jgi:hypothetical protein
MRSTTRHAAGKIGMLRSWFCARVGNSRSVRIAWVFGMVMMLESSAWPQQQSQDLTKVDIEDLMNK